MEGAALHVDGGRMLHLSQEVALKDTEALLPTSFWKHGLFGVRAEL